MSYCQKLYSLKEQVNAEIAVTQIEHFDCTFREIIYKSFENSRQKLHVGLA